MIIGLSGFARSGKDTVAEMLPNYSRRAFADKLREAIFRLNPMIEGGMRVQEVVNLMGWEKAKVDFAELRRLLQVIGTEVGRQMIDNDLWVKLATENLVAGDRVVFTDVRFPNEAAMVKALGGQVWRINRKGVVALNDHASEHAMTSWNFDITIENDGTLDDLHRKVLSALS